MKKSLVFFLVLSLVFMFSFAAIAAPKSGGTLGVTYSSDPTSLDVHRTPSTSFYHELIFETLVYFGFDLQYHGLLAHSWEFANGGRDVTFFLREGIVFHDGTPMNAEAVAFNFNRVTDPALASPGAGQLSGFLGATILGEYVVTLSFEEPISSLLYNLCQMFFGIQSPTAIKKYSEDYGQDVAVGTGPFKFESWEAGDRITMVRNEDYNWAPAYYENRGPSYLDRVVFYSMPDEMTRLLSLMQGSIDISGIPTQYIALFHEEEKVNINEAPVGRVNYLGLNCSKYPWSDVRVRQAIAHTIDRDEIVKVVLNNYAVPNPTPIGTTVLGHDPTLYQLAPAKDIEAGKELLVEAGFRETDSGWLHQDGQPLILEIMTYTTSFYPHLAQVLREQIIQLGIGVEIKTLESATLLAATPKGEHDGISIAYGWSDPDILTYFFHSKNLDRTNRVHYANPVMDQLLDRAQTTIDTLDRIALYREIQEILITESPWINLFTPLDIIGIRSNVIGFMRSPRGSYLIHDVYLQ